MGRIAPYVLYEDCAAASDYDAVDLEAQFRSFATPIQS